jgi:hypothetical protein
MRDFQQSCQGLKGCQLNAKFACSFGGSTYFLCHNCINHSPASFELRGGFQDEQGSKLAESSYLTHIDNTLPDRSTALESSLMIYLKRIHIFKHKIEKFKAKILQLIDLECSQKLKQLDQMRFHGKVLLKSLRSRKNLFNSFDEDLLSSYESNGLKGVLKDYKDSFEINNYETRHFIKSMILIRDKSHDIKQEFYIKPEDLIPETPSPQETFEEVSPKPLCSYSKPTDTIFIAKHSTKKLIKYDASKNQTSTFDLSDSLSQNFYYSSTCILPNGSVMIVGGKGPVTGNTYRYDPSKNTCISLNKLTFPRGYVHLFCLDKYLYALGGQHSDKAERMEWYGNGWCRLPNLREVRYCFGSYYSTNRLYCIGGQNNITVEYYDFELNNFFILPNITVPMGGNVVGVVNEKIYLVTNQVVSVMDLEFREIEREERKDIVNAYNLADLLVRDKFFIFSCSNNCSVLYFNTENKARGRLIKI